MGGFFSKLIIIWAALKTGHPVLATVAVLASILTLAYYAKLQKSVFLGQLNEAFKNVREAPFAMSLPVIILAVISIGLGVLLLPVLRDSVLDPAVQAIQGGVEYARMVLGG
jgi:multicomponent Na+:H+ antiporter subunit D